MAECNKEKYAALVNEVGEEHINKMLSDVRILIKQSENQGVPPKVGDINMDNLVQGLNSQKKQDIAALQAMISPIEGCVEHQQLPNKKTKSDGKSL
jgi:hypothetical protein